MAEVEEEMLHMDEEVNEELLYVNREPAEVEHIPSSAMVSFWLTPPPAAEVICERPLRDAYLLQNG